MMMRLALAGMALLACATVHVTAQHGPVARHVTAVVERGQQVTVTLLPYDKDGHPVECTIESLPAVGTIHQVSPNYITYGYTPVKGSQITSVPTTLVAGSNHQFVYVAPLDFEPVRFNYSVNDTSENLVSNITSIVDVTSTTKQLLQSNFHFDRESWQKSAAAASAADWSGTSTGALNHYIYSGDVEPAVGQVNNIRWHFLAPSTYLRDNAIAYNGQLRFWLGSFAGEFTAATRYPNPIDFVRLECATCNGGLGLAISQRNIIYTGAIDYFDFLLSEEGGWLKDPQDLRVTEWSLPTKCEVIQVLTGLSAVRIYGDFTPNYEAIGIDGIEITTGSGVPLECY